MTELVTGAASKSFSSDQSSLVTVLLRTKNEAASIGGTLEALLSQTYKNIELLVVDSGSTDKTLEIARKYPVRIYKIPSSDFTFGYSLNFGFRHAAGVYVACLSAHALPATNDWLEILMSNVNNDRVAAVMSNTVPFPDCNPFDRRGLIKKYTIAKQDIFEGEPYIFSNSCSLIRKRIWDQVPFDESLIASEDHDWIRKVIKLSYRIVYDPAAKVYHSHNETLKQIYDRYYREAYANNLLRLQRYPLSRILFDMVAGSLYDIMYVLVKRDNVKWIFFAPFRRFAMNLGRYRATRNQ
jgi:rhamnosyltransferase